VAVTEATRAGVGTAEAELITFSAGGVGLVLDLAGPSLPRVLHWGADLGPLDGPAAEALAAALAQADPADRIVVFGSFYTVGGVLKDGPPRLVARHLG
jgi:hypothetical protein